MKNHYEVLDLSLYATPEEIRQQFRMLARIFHPDRLRGDAKVYGQERLKEINTAYEVLSDPVSRAKYNEELKSTPIHEDSKTESDTWHVLRRYCLTLNDLPGGFVITEQEEVSAESAALRWPDPEAALVEFKRQNRLKSYVIKFERLITHASWNKITMYNVVSQVILFADESGAAKGADFIVLFERNKGAQEIDVSHLTTGMIAQSRISAPNPWKSVAFQFVTRVSERVSVTYVLGIHEQLEADEAARLAWRAVMRLRGRTRTQRYRY